MPRSSFRSSIIKIKSKRGLADSVLRYFRTLRFGFKRSDPQSPSAGTPKHPSELLSSLTLKDLENAKKIGSGGYGEVLLLDHPQIGKVALKRLRFDPRREEGQRQRNVRSDMTLGDMWLLLLMAAHSALCGKARSGKRWNISTSSGVSRSWRPLITYFWPLRIWKTDHWSISYKQILTWTE